MRETAGGSGGAKSGWSSGKFDQASERAALVHEGPQVADMGLRVRRTLTPTASAKAAPAAAASSRCVLLLAIVARFGPCPCAECLSLICLSFRCSLPVWPCGETERICTCSACVVLDNVSDRGTDHQNHSYISYRQSYAHHPTKRSGYTSTYGNGRAVGATDVEERQGLMAGAAHDNDDAVIEMDMLPPRWLDIQDEVIELLDALAMQMAQLDPLHAKHVLPGFEDDAVKLREEREIEKLTQDITRSFQRCQASIRKIETQVKQQAHISNADEVMARNLQISLATKVGDASARFRKKQAAYMKSMCICHVGRLCSADHQAELRQLSGMGLPSDRSATPGESSYMDPSLLESDADRSFSQSTLQLTAQKRRSNNDATIAQREREIETIAQGIIDLANIFQELQTMVIDQGTMLDRIDYNVDRMVVDVKAADKELKVATNYQKRSTKRKIILLLILLVVGLFILLFTRPKRSSEPAPVQIDDAP